MRFILSLSSDTYDFFGGLVIFILMFYSFLTGDALLFFLTYLDLAAALSSLLAILFLPLFLSPSVGFESLLYNSSYLDSTLSLEFDAFEFKSP